MGLKKAELSEELAEGQINRLEMILDLGFILMSPLFWQKERDVAQEQQI